MIRIRPQRYGLRIYNNDPEKSSEMKAVLFVMSALLLVQSAWAAPDPVNGQKLFAASQCLNCHGTEVFSRPDRKVKSLAELESQVRRCDANLPTNWYDDEILDVVAYLNKTYYKFAAPAANTGAVPAAGNTPAAQ